MRKRTLAGEAIYELDAAAVAALAPELIVTQALCTVCAVSYDEVAELAAALPSRPRVIALDPKTLGETLGDVRTIAEATGRRDQGAELVGGPPRGSTGCGSPYGAAPDRGWRRWSGLTPCSQPVTGPPS